MYRHHIILMIMAASVAVKFTSSRNLNGWYPCSKYTFSGESSSAGHDAQCAVYKAPLCYSGICETPDGVNPNVDIFVKRFRATITPEKASNVWLLQGGPGDASTDMEANMATLHSELEGAVNVYTMDHRGTGRSTFLDCVAAQVTTTGSPLGNMIDPTEVPACAEELQSKYGDLASFSVTTAATDLATFISEHTNGRSTIVYGVSYGTILVERLMHLAPPVVTGYVLDGIATASGASADQFFYSSKTDINFGEVGDAFLVLCGKDMDCKKRFKPIGLKTSLRNLIAKFDKHPNSTCAALISSTEGFEDLSPSFGLRSVLGDMLVDLHIRTMIPPVIYRLQRCSRNDVKVLTHFLRTLFPDTQAKTQDSVFASELLQRLITYSELCETPLPSMSEMTTRFTDATIAGGGLYGFGPVYCSFSKEKSKSCDEFNVGNYEANGIIYKRDKYWNKTATIPSQASVLLLSGKLDPQTPNKYAETLLSGLNGKRKELIVFDYASHGTIVTTPMVAGDLWSESCGMKVFASYVRNGGNLKRLDKSCVDEMPAFNLNIPDVYLTSYFGADEAYDGVLNSSLIPN